jgi:hypothetical protein
VGLRMQEVDERAEDERWARFARELAMLLDGSPDHVEQLVELVRNHEARDDVFAWAIRGVFPILTPAKRVMFSRFMHELAS